MAKNVAIADEPDEKRDEAIFALRLTGRSERLVARQFKVTPKRVREVVARMAPRITPEVRAEELRLELGRLNRVYETFYTMAVEGDAIAANVMIKLSERRSSLYAWDFAPRRDIAITVEQAPRQTSTEQIRLALEKLCSEGRPRPEPEVIEAEIVEEPAP